MNDAPFCASDQTQRERGRYAKAYAGAKLPIPKYGETTFFAFATKLLAGIVFPMILRDRRLSASRVFAIDLLVDAVHPHVNVRTILLL